MHRDDASLQVVHATHVVDDRERGDVVEQRIDREVSSERVLLGGPKCVVTSNRRADPYLGQPLLVPGHRRVWVCGGGLGGFRFGRRHLPSERRNLDGFQPELHMREAESPPDNPAIAEDPLDLIGMRGGADIEVLGHSPEK